jgi:protein TonB
VLADSLYDRRDWVALLPAALVLSLLATVSLRQLVKLVENETALTVSLYEEEPPVAAPPEAVPPQPRTEPVERVQPQPLAKPEPQDTRPIEATAPAREAAPQPPVERPASPPPAAPPVTAAAPAPAPPVAAPLEAGYVARLRAYLESVKRYPTSREARQMRPQGKVRVWLEIARDGQLREAGIEQGSGSMILDGAAMTTVRQGTYPAFPPEAFAGRGTHRFGVTLDYLLEGG